MSPSNGIWLCQRCSKLIDTDIVKYSSVVLQNWKEIAEVYAQRESQGIYPAMPEPSIAIDSHIESLNVCVEPGRSDHPGVFFISYFAKGELVCGCELKLRNRGTESQLIADLNIELRRDETLLAVVPHTVHEVRSIELPARIWTNISLLNAFPNSINYQIGDEIWLKYRIVGIEVEFELRLGDIAKL